MAIIENRTRTKYKGAVAGAGILAYVQRCSALFFIVISLHLIYFSPYNAIRSGTLEGTGSIIYVSLPYIHKLMNAVSSITDYTRGFKSLRTENLMLKLEIARLNDLEQRAFLLTKENESLKKYSATVNILPYNIITARITLLSTGLYSQAAVVQAGTKDGIEVGQIVVYHDKLVGRINQVSKNHATVLLTTDRASKIPVISSTARMHGIISGNQDGECILLYTPSEDKLKIGEVLITSGDGKYYPHGLIVATIKKILDHEVVTIPAVDLHNVDFVGIIKPLLD